MGNYNLSTDTQRSRVKFKAPQRSGILAETITIIMITMLIMMIIIIIDLKNLVLLFGLFLFLFLFFVGFFCRGGGGEDGGPILINWQLVSKVP